MRNVVIIPARMAAVRLPNKPLLEIQGVPMVIRVAQQAIKANVGEVVIAAGDPEIMDCAAQFGVKAILTDPQLPSGTDRVYAAYKQLEQEYDYIINLQGDLPFIAPDTIKKVAHLLQQPRIEIATAAAHITEERQINTDSVVKIAMTSAGKALYFSRSRIPHNAAVYWHHIGIYGYSPKILQRFVALPVSVLEQTEKLEQLRAMEDGISINVAHVDDIPISVDTLDDFHAACKFAS